MSRSPQPAVGLLRELEDVFTEHEPLRIRFAPKELISQAGSYAAGIYLVTSGIVHESYAETANPKHEVSTGRLGPSSLIGSELLLPDGLQLHRVTCRAVTEVSLSFLERSAFEAAAEAHGVLRRFLAAHLAERSQNLIRAVWRSQLKSVERVSALLRDLAPFGEPTADGRTALPAEIDLRRLADLSYVSYRKMKQACEALPCIEWDGSRFVLSPEELDDRWSQGF